MTVHMALICAKMRAGTWLCCDVKTKVKYTLGGERVRRDTVRAMDQLGLLDLSPYYNGEKQCRVLTRAGEMVGDAVNMVAARKAS